MAMILPRFQYKKARTLEEAIYLFTSFDGRAVYLAGGTDLIPRLKLRLEKPMAVIDIKPIDELYKFEESDDGLHIGSLLNLFDLKNNEIVKNRYPALWESLDATSCETLQMRGTIGGNILQNTRCIFYNQSEFWRRAKGFCFKMGGDKCNAVKGAKRCFANYCSDNAPSLISLDTKVKIIGLEGEKIIPLEDIYTGKSGKPFNLSPGDILVEFIIPKKETKGGYEKLRLRGSIDYPLLGVAFSSWNGSGKLVIGAIGGKPLSYNIDKLDAENIEEAIERAYQDATPVANTVLSPVYRKRMVKVLSEKLIKRILGG